jgi:tetratricopeptide (TPR) repeat protein
MKNLYQNIIFICLILPKIYSQTPQRVFVVDKLTSASTDSKIEVAPNGDTVLVSKFVYQDPKTYARQYTEKTYKGTPFFKNKWDKGVIYFKDGSTVEGMLAFNLVNNLVYYSVGDIKNAIEAKPEAFTACGITFMKLNKKYENQNSGYFETIFANTKVDLFKQYACIYRPKITGDRLGYEPEGGDYEGNFDKLSKFVMGYQNNLVELKTNNNIYKQFGDYRKAIELFAKEKKLNPRKESDVLKMVMEYSNLLSQFDK